MESIINIYGEVSTALSKKDIDTALSYFSDRKEMTKISNGRILKGKNELRSYWEERLKKVKELKLSIDHIQVYPIDEKHVWSTANELISTDGDIQKAVVSNIFVQTRTGWKILLDHTTYIN